ncbi:MAG: hemolysin secretion protein [Rhodocyclales bacterium]|nr:hemolysin secretion protein [Rhodocyclales bacterium]
MSIKLKFQAAADLLARYRAVFSHAWQQRRAMAGPGYTTHEAQFLPAALSLQETPLSPAPRVAMWLLIAFAFITLLWATFGKIDVVASAQGKIVPNDRVKTIQPLDRSTVKAIHVTDGQAVKAGDVLIEFDDATSQADQDRVRSDLAAARLQALRAKSMLQALDTGHLPVLLRPEQSTGSMWVEAQSLLTSQFNDYNAKRARLAADIAQREAELRSTQELVRKMEQTLPIAKQREEDYKNLVAQNFVSRHGYLEKEQARIELEADLANQRSKLGEIRAALQSAHAQQNALLTESRRTTLDSANEALQKVAGLEQDLLKASSRNQQNTLSSPVDGTVQQLAIHTVGGVVKEADTLMIIVPKDNPLEIEAMIENKDIGFVNAGQEAAVKVETFQYTKYGTIHAKVTSVSNDAINDEKRGLIYTAKVKMDRSTLDVDGKQVNLSPGMAVGVEIKTGKRRVIEYFLSPLMQYKHESLRER